MTAQPAYIWGESRANGNVARINYRGSIVEGYTADSNDVILNPVIANPRSRYGNLRPRAAHPHGPKDHAWKYSWGAHPHGPKGRAWKYSWGAHPHGPQGHAWKCSWGAHPHGPDHAWKYSRGADSISEATVKLRDRRARIIMGH